LIDDSTMRAHVDPAEAQAVLHADVRIGWPRGAGAGYRDGPAIRLVLSGTAEHPLLTSDLPDTTA